MHHNLAALLAQDTEFGLFVQSWRHQKKCRNAIKWHDFPETASHKDHRLSKENITRYFYDKQFNLTDDNPEPVSADGVDVPGALVNYFRFELCIKGLKKKHRCLTK